MSVKIRLLGTPKILDDHGHRQTVRGHQAWALLARILLSEQPVYRRNIATELFPDADDPLGSLRWCLASLRRALKSPDSLCNDPIESNLPPNTEVDVHRLEKAGFEDGSVGDLLEGIDPRCSFEFSTWLLIERERLAGLINGKIRQETLQAVSVGDYLRAIQLAGTGVRRAPFDEAAHILLVKSLTLAERHEAALDHVKSTERVFLEELGEKPTAALRSAARRTIASPPGGVAPRAVVDSLLDAGLAALAAGAVDAGVDCLRRATAEAEKHTDRQLHAKALLELGTALVHSIRGYDDEGAVVLRQSIELARQCGSANIASTGFRELGYVDALAGRRPDAEAHLAEALTLAKDNDDLSGIHIVTGFNLVDWGKVDDGLDHYRISLDYARGARNRQLESWTLGLGGWGLRVAGHFDDANSWLTDCLKLVDDIRWVAFRPWPVAVLGESRIQQKEDPIGLLPDLEGAFALACQLGDPCWEAAVARSMGLSHAAMNDYDRAMEWLVEARKRVTRVTDIYVALLVEILADQVDISRKLGQEAQSDALAREYLSMAARTHMDLHVNRAISFLN